MFYILVMILILYFALNCIFTNNTVYSIFYLIMVFCLSSILLLNFGIDYIPLVLIIVYVGALSVLFLFVVMMLNIKIYRREPKFMKYVIFLIFTSIICFVYYLNYNYFGNFLYSEGSFDIMSTAVKLNIMEAVGRYLFLDGYIYIILLSILLFVAIIGSVFLVIEYIKDSKIQQINRQVTRDIESSYFLVKKK